MTSRPRTFRVSQLRQTHGDARSCDEPRDWRDRDGDAVCDVQARRGVHAPRRDRAAVFAAISANDNRKLQIERFEATVEPMVAPIKFSRA